jgi:hypothetical protein
VVAVVAFQAHDGGRGRAQHAYPFVAGLFEPLSKKARPLQCVVKLFAANEDVGESGVWRVVHPTAEAEFFFVKAEEVMLRGILNGVVILKVGLEDDLAGGLAASGSSGDLSKQLKGSLGGAEVRQSESDVGANDAHERYTMDIVAFGDHLRADEEVELPLVESTERALEVFVAADGVAIEASDARLREHAVKQLLQFL